MGKQEKDLTKRSYPHPYIMDSDKVELKLAYQTLNHTESLKEMVREFSRYHAFCFHARELLSCNIDKIAMDKPPHPYPTVPLPGNCPDDNKPWQETK